MDVELDLTIHRSYLHGTRVEGTGRTPNGYYPRNFGNERSGVTLKPGDRRLRASLFNEEGGTIESCLMLTAEFSWDWKTIRTLSFLSDLSQLGSDISGWPKVDTQELMGMREYLLISSSVSIPSPPCRKICRLFMP